MHELALAKDVLNKIKEDAKKKGIDKVSYAKVTIGETLITDPKEFEELFAAVSAGIVAEGMRLNIEIALLKARCADCKTEFAPTTKHFDCANCGSMNIHLISGREITIKELK